MVLIVLTQWKFSHSLTIYGQISNNVTYIHKSFTVPPSMRAIIEVSVSYPVRVYYYKSHRRYYPYYPVLGIYTTVDHINIRSQCIHTKYGQLLNFNLHPGITLDRHQSRPLKCLPDNNTIGIHCIGNITIQDFKPRHFSFPFGFHCQDRCASWSLNGLVYRLTIYGQTNRTKCVTLSFESAKDCYPYSQYSMFPNLLGHTHFKDLSFHYQLGYSSTCYQHAVPFCVIYTYPDVT